MTWEQLVLVGAGFLVVLGFAVFAIVSAAERERRAAWIAVGLATGCGVPLLAASVWAPIVHRPLVMVVLGLAAVALLLFLAPVGRAVLPGGRTEYRVDERDIMFARVRLQSGSPEYEAYYAMRPEHRAGDDKTRALPGFLSIHGELAEPVALASTCASFAVTDALRREWKTEVASDREERSPAQWSETIKALLRYHGALDVGITELRAEHVYSHIGRGVGRWGAEIEPEHEWGIAFTVEMDHAAVAHAPGAETTMESARRYVDITTIGIQVAEAIRLLGYDARAHTDGNYRVIAPLLARDCGLGDLGRMGLLMTPRLGTRARIGAVTTDLPLVADAASNDREMLDFCSVCLKCADNCPVGAIPSGDREEWHGGLRWSINSEACFRYWAVAGTDCCNCMRVCPYSHPDNAAHNLVRWAIRRSGVARRALLWLDDLFYGRKPHPRPPTATGVP